AIVGTEITVEGYGFSTNTLVWIDFGTSQTIATSATNTNGTFSATFIVDTQPGGTTTITANSYQLTANSYFIILPSITLLSPQSGIVGTEVTIEGSGVNSGIIIDFGTDEIIAFTQSSQNGTFSATFIVSTQLGGTKVITASYFAGVDESGNFFFVYATTVFRILPSIISLFPDKAAPFDSVVTIIGSGFSDGLISIHLGKTQTITVSWADENGIFSALFLVDDQLGGTVTITAEDNLSFATTSFYVLPIIWISPESGPVGTLVTVEGLGYFAFDEIAIDFGNTLTITTANTESFGSFLVTFFVDSQPYSSITITARGQTGEATAIFFIKPGIILIPDYGSFGNEITVIGSGYGSTETITISFGQTLTITTGTSFSSGTFSITFIVDTQLPQILVVTAEGDSGAVST
ncbi:MAG: hypothetical protein AAB296_00125, partial [Candidatus Desantisbacteria bacterium]